ncbi:CAMK/CAMKL protein kinase [Sphaeroforma arctica JP610]|uniref:CAMK/CAMKL protein kinase n=1 Tax=Sphaeroforma arctica JP610 TaxID=667725 RepID=A0A0L0G9I0_9EUKA|nr:CAMK/CAMKL protein kinase [Sphaeroforma arctica JP610]KNC85650.1 CAMK/CAMKL protein kinase [Sphaeroforma arctica JP610]|eukprot:XP_014159552.1 CAMK/CAMKL protein kinase [Sphaeroforma arctica JP610]
MRIQLQFSSNLSASHNDLKGDSSDSNGYTSKSPSPPAFKNILSPRSNSHHEPNPSHSPIFHRHHPRENDNASARCDATQRTHMATDTTTDKTKAKTSLQQPQAFSKTKRRRSKSSCILLNNSGRTISTSQLPTASSARAPRFNRMAPSLQFEHKNRTSLDAQSAVPAIEKDAANSPKETVANATRSEGNSGNEPNYKVLRAIQNGITSTVFQAIEMSTGRMVAIKRLAKSPHNLRLVQTEARIAHALQDHKNIVKLYEVVETPSHYLLIQEYLPSGDLFEYIVDVDGKDLSEKACLRIFKQVVSALSYMHTKGWCHRDVKLENVVLGDDGIAKLCDFGFSCAVHDTSATTPGTVEYTCPELLSGLSNVDLRKADVWSAGILLFALLTCEMEYEFPWPRAANTCAEFLKYRTGDVDSLPWNTFSPLVRVLLSYLLEIDPHKRYSMDECLAFVCEYWPDLEEDVDAMDEGQEHERDGQVLSLQTLKHNMLSDKTRV